MKITPTLVIVYLRFLIICNNDFGVIVEIAIYENSNYFFIAQKQLQSVAAYEDSFIHCHSACTEWRHSQKQNRRPSVVYSALLLKAEGTGFECEA